jgi:hypothetical protein
VEPYTGDEALPPPFGPSDGGPSRRQSISAEGISEAGPGTYVHGSAPAEATKRWLTSGGGVAAQFARSAMCAIVVEPAMGKALRVSDGTVNSLFGPD